MRELSKKMDGEARNPDPQHSIQTNKNKKRLVRRLVLFLTFALTVVVSLNVTFYKQRELIAGKEKAIVDLKKQMNKLEAEEQLLKDEIKKLNDDEYIAKIARRDYFFSNKNETIFPVQQP